MKTFARIAAVASATLLFATAASAAVIYNGDGTGWVGKGDVQMAFGWNNATAQRNVEVPVFYVESEDSYDVTCSWTTVTGGPKSKVIPHAVTNTKRSSVNRAVSRDARRTGQWTGYTLTGFGAETVSGTPVPSIGDPCPQGGGLSDNDPPANDAVVTAVSPGSSTGGLYVTDGSAVALLQAL